MSIDNIILHLDGVLAELKTHAEADKFRAEDYARLLNHADVMAETAERRKVLIEEKNEYIQTLETKLKELTDFEPDEPEDVPPTPEIALIIAGERQGENVTEPTRNVYPYVQHRDDIEKVVFYLNGQRLGPSENITPYEAFGGKPVKLYGPGVIKAEVLLKNGELLSVEREVQGLVDTAALTSSKHKDDLLLSLDNHPEVEAWTWTHEQGRIAWGQFVAPACLGARLSNDHRLLAPVKRHMDRTKARLTTYSGSLRKLGNKDRQEWDRVLWGGLIADYVEACDRFPEYYEDRDFWLKFLAEDYTQEYRYNSDAVLIYNEAHTTAAHDWYRYVLGKVGGSSTDMAIFEAQLNDWFTMPYEPGTRNLGGFHFYIHNGDRHVTVPYGALRGGLKDASKEARYDRAKAADWTYARVLPDVFTPLRLNGVDMPNWEKPFVNAVKNALIKGTKPSNIQSRIQKFPGVGMSTSSAPFPNGDYRDGVSVDQAVSSGLCHMIAYDESGEIEAVFDKAHEIVMPHVNRPAIYAARMLKEFLNA